jgi:hypothetical protein
LKRLNTRLCERASWRGSAVGKYLLQGEDRDRSVAHRRRTAAPGIEGCH